MKCHNRNLKEYKVLAEYTGSEITTNIYINKWQEANETDDFPTLKDMKDFLSLEKKNIKNRNANFKNTVLNNLVNLGFLTKAGNKYIVPNNKHIEVKLELAKRYLNFNGISSDVLKIEKKKTYKEVSINSKKGIFIDPKFIEANNNSNRTLNLIGYLKNLFPNIKINYLSEKQAEKYYNSLPNDVKSRVDFNQVKSFYYNGEVILIEERVTNETAIEEVLHPFVNSLQSSNLILFNNLYNESKKTFPTLNEEIESLYNDDDGFTKEDRKLELVTQALTKYFNKEYEKNTSNNFKNRLREFMIWVGNIINKLYKAVTGLNLNIKPISIRNNTTLSDLAKKLNTKRIQFNPNPTASRKVQYSLSEDKKRVVNFALDGANDKQKAIINKLFKLAQTSEEEFSDLFISNNLEGENEYKDLIVFDEESHTYININHAIDGSDAAEYTPVSTIIKGEMDSARLEEYKLNLTIGNYFDSLMNAILSGIPYNEIATKLPMLDNFNKGEEAYDFLSDFIKDNMPIGSVAIPQVIVHNRDARIAGTVDILIILPNGKLRIIDLKTSKNPATFNEGKPEKEWELKKDSSLINLGIKSLSTRQQHNFQVNMYRTMLELMGYQFDSSEEAVQTMHVKVEVLGKGKDQVFTGVFEQDEIIKHPISQNKDTIDKIFSSRQDLDLEIEIGDIEVPEDEITVEDMLTETEMLEEEKPHETGDHMIVYNILQRYKDALLKKQEVIDNIKSNMYMNRSTKQTKEYIVNSISTIILAENEGPRARSALYTTLLRDALKQIKDFKEYIEEPSNFNNENYIGYVLNFNRFAETFRGLYEVKKSEYLNDTQRSIILKLQSELNALVGVGNETGIIDQSITNYVKEVIKTNSNRNFSEQDLNDLLTVAQDITGTTLQVGETSSSSDTLLALMDKIYKNKKQEFYDVLEEMNDKINLVANRLQKVSSEKDVQKLFNFMLEFDENGLPTGEIISKMGPMYTKTLTQLRNQLIDENGVWKQYRPVYDVKNASKADIEYNIKLAKAKEEYSNFWKAEKKGAGNKPVDGDFHKYTQEIKDIRKKYEVYISNGKGGYWTKKSKGVSNAAYTAYKTKYFDTIEYTQAVRKNGLFTGQISSGVTIQVPKRKYVENTTYTSKGESLLNERYKSIMENTDTELGRAQKEYYLAHVETMEKLLNVLPPGIKSSMTGKIPLIRSKLYNNLKSKPNIVTRLWTKMTRSIDNLTTETNTQRLVSTDENGEIIDSLPIYYTGKIKDESELKAVIDEIDLLHEKRKNKSIDIISYKKKLKELNSKRLSIENSIGADELNLDLATGLKKFAGMSEHYRVMGTIEDTLKAMVKAIENRKYTQASGNKLVTYLKGEKKETYVKGSESNILRRAKKFMHMIYYDNDQLTKNFYDKVAEKIIDQTSLSYIAFNVFGNFNNYTLGRLNNSIEALGERFTSKKSYGRAVLEYNKVFIPGLIQRTAYGESSDNLKDVLTFNTLNFANNSAYDSNKPMNKYEAFTDLFRMMDDKGDIREKTSGADSTYKSWWSKFKEFGYIFQDAGEYNVQTKMGMSIVIDQVAINPETGETLSLYDAMDFDGSTQTLVLKKGFKIKKKDGTIVDFDDAFRYNLRNYIREVIKQAHGSYAYEDRVVMQSATWGKLIFQFHKWVIPAIKARYRKEYFDENLGWMEGRYISFFKFLAYVKQQIAQGNTQLFKYKETFLEEQKEAFLNNLGQGEVEAEQYANNKMANVYRTVSELMITLTVFMLKQIFQSFFSGDEDDSDLEKRFENILMYQSDRTYKELTIFMPFLPSAYVQVWQAADTPIASLKLLGEMGEALEKTVTTPFARIVKSKDEFYADSDYVYQRKPKKGQLKLAKEWKDVVPILYTLQKWNNYLEERDFYIK